MFGLNKKKSDPHAQAQKLSKQYQTIAKVQYRDGSSITFYKGKRAGANFGFNWGVK